MRVKLILFVALVFAIIGFGIAFTKTKTRGNKSANVDHSKCDDKNDKMDLYVTQSDVLQTDSQCAANRSYASKDPLNGECQRLKKWKMKVITASRKRRNKMLTVIRIVCDLYLLGTIVALAIIFKMLFF